MGIEDQPEAFYLDRAVTIFGTHVEAEIEKAESARKSARSKGMARAMVLQRYLGAGTFANAPGR